MNPAADDGQAEPEIAPAGTPHQAICRLCMRDLRAQESVPRMVRIADPIRLVRHACGLGPRWYSEWHRAPSCGCATAWAGKTMRLEPWCGACARLAQVADARDVTLPRRTFA